MVAFPDSPAAEHAPTAMATCCKLVAGLVVPALGLSIAEALIEVAKLCAEIKERNDRCRQVLVQMEQMRAELEGDVDERALAESNVLELFVGTIDAFVEFARDHCGKTKLRQWLRTNKLADKMREFEDDMAFQLHMLQVKHIVKTEAYQKRMEDRTSDIVIKMDALLKVTQGGAAREPHEMETRHASMMRYVSTKRLVVEEAQASDVVESLAIMKYEMKYNVSRHSPEEMEVLKTAFEAVKVSSKADVPEIPRWFISSDDVEFNKNKPFAMGAYGTAHRGTWKKARVVVKRLLTDSAAARKSFFKEVEVWKRLDHPHVVKLFGACHVTRPAFFVAEDCVNNNLNEYLEKDKSEMWRLLFEAAVGLMYIHDQHVVHGDLKCGDILVGADGLAKISDFGFAFIRSESKSLSCKTQTEEVCWKAPELHGFDPSGEYDTRVEATGNQAARQLVNPRFSSDVYSFGMCVLEAFTGELPFGIMGCDEILDKLSSEETSLPDRPEDMTDDVWEFLTKLLAFDWRERPSMPTVVDQLKRFADCEAGENTIKHTCNQCRAKVPFSYAFCAQCGCKLGQGLAAAG
jgi:serine/threonine protein kinase